MARLCALSQMPEAAAMQAFRDAYRTANQTLASRSSEESDAFSAAQVLGEWHQNPIFLGPERLDSDAIRRVLEPPRMHPILPMIDLQVFGSRFGKHRETLAWRLLPAFD